MCTGPLFEMIFMNKQNNFKVHTYTEYKVIAGLVSLYMGVMLIQSQGLNAIFKGLKK